MFKIERLDLYNTDDNVASYVFESGINYFIGKNNSGKTEFYKFIDYMFGSSIVIKNSIWYKGTLSKATMYFTYNGISYRISRVLATDKCYFSYTDEVDGESIDLSEYKERLQAVFAVDKAALESLHKFTDERLTYRSFTLFNFLGEIRQGVLVDFFDKCSEIEYSTKVSPILNFIFNKNVTRIFWLKNEITRLQDEIKQKEQVDGSNKHFIYKVNLNLNKLNIKGEFDGSNGDIILAQLSDLANQIELSKPLTTKSVSDLEVICNNIDEQIKVCEKYKLDLQHQQRENKNREHILDTFQSIIKDRPDFNYLVEPLINLADEIKNSISFSQYFLKDDVLEKLKKQRQKVKNEIVKSEMQLTRFSLDDKKKAIAIAEDGIKSYSTECSPAELEKLRKELKDYKKELKELQDLDDAEKINSISTQITNLYKSAYQTSDFVQKDFNETNDAFHITYIKSKNTLQTMTFDEKRNERVYGTGSHARHTLIQLCGYLVFMKMLIEENRYPIIPILVIDHISKPFDDQSIAAIGTVIHKAYESIGIDNLQIFMFDDENNNKLNLNPNHIENLANDVRTGFNPFYNAR